VIGGHDFVETHNPTNLVKVAVHLRRFCHRNTAFGPRGNHRVVGDGAKNRAMGDDTVDCAASAVCGGIPVTNPIRFEDDVPTRGDERADRVPVRGSESLRIQTESTE
jgi:hypothetical protein